MMKVALGPVRFIVASICAASVSCVSKQPEQVRSTDISGVPGVPGRYAFLFEGYQERVFRQPEVIRQGLPYQSISISRSGCEGKCAAYSASLKADGPASFEGQSHVENIGRFTGSVSLIDFGQLCYFIERSGFMKLSDRYAAPMSDAQTVTVSVAPRTAGLKTVSDYGRWGPPDLWVLERAIDGVVDRIKWARE